MRHQIEYDHTSKDLTEYYIYAIRNSKERRKRNWWILGGIIIMPFLLSGPSIFHGNKLDEFQVGIFALAVILLISFPIYWRLEPSIIARRAVRRFAGTKLDPFGPTKLIISKQRIEYEKSSSGGWANWDMISSIDKMEDYFLITIAMYLTFIIPLRAFDNREEFDQFKEQVNDYRNAKPSFEQICPECKYDLSGSECTGCPECGWQREG